MKFTIDKQDLQANIQHLYNIVPSKNTMPILTNYLIKAEEENSTITFTVTDLEITRQYCSFYSGRRESSHPVRAF
jgi:DNA polymerase III sliding clamp (beta) subunit (PCNA family)